jgi:PAS domain S-box-containing protein
MSPRFPFPKKGNKIGKRMITMIIAFSSLITFCITAFQLFVDYREQLTDLDFTLNGVEVNVPTISSSVWSFDEDQINLALEALINLHNIERAVIVTQSGTNTWSAGAELSKHVETRTYPLTILKRGNIETIGTLEVIASLDAIYERVFSKALGILISNGIKTFLVALFMFAIFYKLVTKRIEILAEKVRSLTTELIQSDEIDHYQAQPDHDEIQTVQYAFDHMAGKLRQSVNAINESNKSLQHAYEEVQTINAELELRVHERTQHLRQEIVEREYAQESLKTSEQRLRDIAESAADWFWETNPDHLLTYVSYRFYEVTGLSPEDTLGKSLLANAGQPLSDEEQLYLNDYQEVLRNNLPLEDFRYRLLTPEGKTFFIELSGRPYFDHNEKCLGYRGAARDITEQTLYQKKLKAAREQADSANHTKSEFISSMTHELRTPLNGILGFAQLLEMNPKQPLNELQSNYVHQILYAGHHLLNLINEILDLAKVEAGKVQLSLEPISPTGVIKDSIEILEALAGKYKVEIFTDFSEVDQNIQISVDLTRFSQIIMNLCSNAIKYNRQNGSVTIKVEKQPNDWVRISVTDTGFGIAQDQLEFLFTPFNRLQAEGSKTEGTGVGLSITQKLVELMSGHMGVESRLNEGSTFWFEFKALKERAVHTENVSLENHTIPTLQLLPCRVLYIEDNLENLLLVEEIFLNQPDAILFKAMNAEAGLDIVFNEKLDLILMDINLPGMDGFSALKEVRRHPKFANLPIIALSANVRPDVIERARQVGFNDFIAKPINIPTLLQAINANIKK